MGDVIEKMLKKKVPKLVKTVATKRVLLIERRHPNLYPESIHSEIDQRRPAFPELADVHEIWIVEKMPFFQPGDGDAYFELREAGETIKSFGFHDGKLVSRADRGMPVSIPQSR
jgi:hypothetical protein